MSEPLESTVFTTTGIRESLFLALLAVAIRPNDSVLLSAFESSLAVEVLNSVRAKPWFVDSAPESGSMDPESLTDQFEACRRRGIMPRAVLANHPFGRDPGHSALRKISEFYEVPLIELFRPPIGMNRLFERAGAIADFVCLQCPKAEDDASRGILVVSNSLWSERAVAAISSNSLFREAQGKKGIARYLDLRETDALGDILNYRSPLIKAKYHRLQEYVSRLSWLPGIAVMSQTSDACDWVAIGVNASHFGVNRDQLLDAILKHGFGCSRPESLESRDSILDTSIINALTVASRLSRDVLYLPNGENMTHDSVRRICDIIRDCCCAPAVNSNTRPF